MFKIYNYYEFFLVNQFIPKLYHKILHIIISNNRCVLILKLMSTIKQCVIQTSRGRV